MKTNGQILQELIETLEKFSIEELDKYLHKYIDIYGADYVKECWESRNDKIKKQTLCYMIANNDVNEETKQKAIKLKNELERK